MGTMEPDDLYGLPLERFVPERGTLARALRADGQRQQAADVAGLRKPTVAAWAVNQLVRTQGRAVAALCDAGDKLREAQADVLAGRGDGRALRAAVDRERVAVDALVIAARGLLTSDGHELSASVIDRVSDTMHAAALDEDARATVRQGRLERELRHVGLGVVAAPAPAARRRHKPQSRAQRGTPDGPGSQEQGESERVARERAEAERAEAERERSEAARANESQARRVAADAQRAARAAEERRDRAALGLRDADAALAQAQAQLEAANDAHRRAQEELTRRGEGPT
jgi:hypothetical protein